jgi:hypothetical protein
MHGYLDLAFEYANSLYFLDNQVILKILFHNPVDVTDKFL